MKHNFRFTIVFLLTATMLLYSASYMPTARAQSTSGTTVENLTFHYYSLMQKVENGSYFVYDGADAVGPRLTTAYQTTLNSQIMGTRSGFTYWSAVIAWAVQLQKDIHVLGNVEIKAYVSSAFEGFGFFDGGGYGMGLADIDENQNIVEQFITEGPQSWGNPFTGTPQLYTLSVNVDYVFEKGHYLGFFVGAGATIQGFTFTVYFDSPDRNSGASLPIAESTTPPQLDHITIIPSSKILQIGSTQQFSAQGYDQNNNSISGLNFSWTVTGGIGSVNPTSGQTTTFTSSTVGDGSLSATTTYGGVTKIGSASITVTTTPPLDITPPTITHMSISAANDGQTITISATITDNVAVTEAKLYYRKFGEKTYTSITMTQSGTTYTGTIPASIVTTSGVQYYMNATDGTNFSTHPAVNPSTSPHTITVTIMNMSPTAVTLNNPSNITQNSMKLIWTQNTEADFARYEIYQSITSGTLGTKIYTITERPITAYTVRELSANATYYFTVRVVDTAGLFADSVQVNGRTTQSSQIDGTDTVPPWIWWVAGGLAAISAALAITLLALRQRKK